MTSFLRNFAKENQRIAGRRKIKSFEAKIIPSLQNTAVSNFAGVPALPKEDVGPRSTKWPARCFIPPAADMMPAAI